MSRESEIYAQELMNNLSSEQLFAILDTIPLGVNVWNDKRELIYTNTYLLELFSLHTREEYTKNFYLFSPELQPDGTSSLELSQNYLTEAYKKGCHNFNWLHVNLMGDEIPCEISMHLFNGMLVTLIKDLRSQLAEYENNQLADGFFYNRITDKALFNAVAELSDEWFWAYESKTAEIQFFGKGIEILGLPTDKNPFPSSVVDSGIVYPDDLEEFLRFDAEMRKGNLGPFDIRFILPDGSHRFYRITYKIKKDAQGRILYAIGKTFDIHEQKLLEQMSKTDLLTNCLNKVATEKAIESAIGAGQEAQHALFIVDVDNFKAVNDNLGHHFGDRVLKEIADNLHQNFRELDIIGRIGGDEFIVFVRNLKDAETIIRKAEAVSKAFKNNYSGENSDYKISGSIGIAMYPKDGDSYQELYKAADKALYQSKVRGKDCYTFYSEDLVDGTMKTLTLLENANRLASSYFDFDMISYVFDTMYEAMDINGAMDMVVQFIGKRLGADRCYTFETFNKGANYSVTHEWCSENASVEIGNLQNIPHEALEEFFIKLEKNNVLYNNDTNVIEGDTSFKLVRGQGIKSFLLVQEKGRDHTNFILGLDDCETSRVWVEREIISLRYVLKILSVFMLNENIRLS